MDETVAHYTVCFFQFFFFFFWCGPFLKSLLNLLQFCLCFLAWVFCLEACGTLASGSEAALEGEILTTGLPGRSLFSILSVVYSAGIYRSCGNSILIFLRKLPAIFHSGCTFYTPTNSAQSFHFLHMPPQQLLFSVLFIDSSHPNRSEVVSFYSFWFAFPKWLVILSNFSWAYWPLVYHLWRTLEEIVNNDMT